MGFFGCQVEALSRVQDSGFRGVEFGSWGGRFGAEVLTCQGGGLRFF